jgi:hypothetical protein
MAAPTLNSEATIVGGVHYLFVAPQGTAMPTTVGNDPGEGLDDAFISLGYTGDDGSKFGVDTQSTDLYASQSYDPLRTIITTRKATVTAPLLEWNSQAILTAFGGGEITAVAGGWRYDPPAAGTIDEISAVIDIVDGGQVTRIGIERGIVVGSVEGTFTKSAFTSLPITITALAPVNEDTAWYLIGSNDALAPVS